MSRETACPPSRDASTAYVYPQHAVAASKAPQNFRLRNAPLDGVNRSVPVGVEHRQCGFEPRRHQQVLEILVATVREEVDHVLISAHRAKNFFFFERAGVVLVDHLERLAREAQKLGGELFVGRGARALAALALLLEVLEALGQAAVDRRLPLLDVDFAGLVLVQGLERLLETRRVEQERQVLVAARR